MKLENRALINCVYAWKLSFGLKKSALETIRTIYIAPEHVYQGWFGGHWDNGTTTCVCICVCVCTFILGLIERSNQESFLL